jgi:hypothetical protein
VVKKVMDDEGRDFRAVFAEAQILLQTTFGMALKELPIKEKVTVRERRGMFYVATLTSRILNLG